VQLQRCSYFFNPHSAVFSHFLGGCHPPLTASFSRIPPLPAPISSCRPHPPAPYLRLLFPSLYRCISFSHALSAFPRQCAVLELVPPGATACRRLLSFLASPVSGGSYQFGRALLLHQVQQSSNVSELINTVPRRKKIKKITKIQTFSCSSSNLARFYNASRASSRCESRSRWDQFQHRKLMGCKAIEKQASKEGRKRSCSSRDEAAGWISAQEQRNEHLVRCLHVCVWLLSSSE